MRATELGKTGNPLNKSNIQVNFIEKLKKKRWTSENSYLNIISSSF